MLRLLLLSYFRDVLLLIQKIISIVIITDIRYLSRLLLLIILRIRILSWLWRDIFIIRIFYIPNSCLITLLRRITNCWTLLMLWLLLFLLLLLCCNLLLQLRFFIIFLPLTSSTLTIRFHLIIGFWLCTCSTGISNRFNIWNWSA